MLPLPQQLMQLLKGDVLCFCFGSPDTVCDIGSFASLIITTPKNVCLDIDY